MIAKPYTTPEVAAKIGITIDTFYRNRRRLEMVDGMPKPLRSKGAHGYERSGFDAWLTRYHPLRAQRPANDAEAPLVPVTVEEHRQELHDYYRAQLAGRA